MSEEQREWYAAEMGIELYDNDGFDELDKACRAPKPECYNENDSGYPECKGTSNTQDMALNDCFTCEWFANREV